MRRERRGGKRGGEGGERRGEEAFLIMWPRTLSALNPPLGVRVSQAKPSSCVRHLLCYYCHN